MRNKELCKRILEVILDMEIDHIEYPEEQKVIDLSKDAKSVRLDVYIKDNELMDDEITKIFLNST
jgi:hypothetical protein